MLAEWTNIALPVVGMLHAPPLAGAPCYGGDFDAVTKGVLRDAEALVDGGVDGLLLENFGDVPFYPGRVPAHTVAQMTALAVAVRRRFSQPLGINVLRNDGVGALAVAHAAGAAFVRVNVLSGARVTDQGIMEGIAHDLLRERARLRAGSIQIWGDVDVKHSAPLAARGLADEVHDLVDRAGADAVIVSGAATGAAVDASELQIVKAATGTVPVVIGSGVTPDRLPELRPHADGLIVGSWFKQGSAGSPVDPARVRELMRARG